MYWYDGETTTEHVKFVSLAWGIWMWNEFSLGEVHFYNLKIKDMILQTLFAYA